MMVGCYWVCSNARPSHWSSLRGEAMRSDPSQRIPIVAGYGNDPLQRSSAQALEQPVLMAVKVVTWGSSLQSINVRMGISPCANWRSGQTTKKPWDWLRSGPLWGSLSREFPGKPLPSTGSPGWEMSASRPRTRRDGVSAAPATECLVSSRSPTCERASLDASNSTRSRGRSPQFQERLPCDPHSERARWR
jgi:hypothetical protein